MYRETYCSLRERAKELFQGHPRIRCPYFGADVILFCCDDLLLTDECVVL